MTQPSPPDPSVRVVEGEVVGPDAFDHLASWLEQRVRDGSIDGSALRALLPPDPSYPEADTGRMASAAAGAALGSLWRAGGAVVGAAIAVVLYDLLRRR